MVNKMNFVTCTDEYGSLTKILCGNPDIYTVLSLQ
jgi:hypothetical protein